MTRTERDQWNREHRCCGACAHWHIWDDANPETDLCQGDCDKIEAGTETSISEDGKQIYTFDGYSFEDECYDEDLHCFEDRELTRKENQDDQSGANARIGQDH